MGMEEKMKRDTIKKTRGEAVLFSAVFIIFFVYALTLILPFAWIFYNSFKGYDEFLYDSIWSFPKNFTFVNWENALYAEAYGVNLPGMLVNSLIFVVGCTTISISCSGMTAYCLAKYKFRGNHLMYTAALLLMLIPSLGSMASTYKFFVDINLYDTYLCMFIMSTSGFGTGFLLLYGFFKSLDWSYAEAAFVDGAGHFIVFFRIMVPMALPGVLSVAIMSAIGIWNDYYTFYMYTPSKVTLSLGLSILLDKAQQSGDFPGLFSMLIISVAPVLVLFCAFQKQIMKNMTVGGLKG